MDRLGLEVAADSAGLDVDDTGCTEGDRRVRSGDGDDRLIEADGCRDALGEERVSAQVVLGQRLLDKEQVEGIHRCKNLRVIARVGLIRVRLHRHVRPGLTDCANRLDIPAGLYLEFDAPVAGIDIGRDLLEEGIDARGDSHGDTAIHLIADRAEITRE